MRAFQFFVTDDRYGVRSVMFVDVKDADAARDLAGRILADNAHYSVIEVFAADKLLFSVGEGSSPSSRSSGREGRSGRRRRSLTD
jgi:hypothetical protein